MELYKSELKDLRNELYKNGKELYRSVFKTVRHHVHEVILFQLKCVKNPLNITVTVFISFFPNNNHKKIFCLELTSTEKRIFFIKFSFFFFQTYNFYTDNHIFLFVQTDSVCACCTYVDKFVLNYFYVVVCIQ